MNCSLPGNGILQAIILSRVAVPSRGSSQPRDGTCVSCVYLHCQAGSSPLAPPWKPTPSGTVLLWYESLSVVSNSLQLHGLYSLWNSPGQNTGVGSLSLLQEIFPTHRLNSGILHCKWIFYQLSYKGNPGILEWVVPLFSSGSSRHRISWLRILMLRAWEALGYGMLGT